MDGHGDRPRAAREPRGFLPRAGAAAPPWRRVWNWLFGPREDIDQEGLLAERTLMTAPRRSDPRGTGSQRDEAPR